MILYTKKQLEAIKFASSSEAPSAVGGLLFEGNKTTATDGHRLKEDLNNDLT